MSPKPKRDQVDIPELTVETAGERADAGSLAAWLVLGLVIQQPSHGYEIYQRFERYGAVLQLSRSSVYAVLNRLRGMRMIEQIDLEPVGPVSRKLESRRSFRATGLGASAYRRWVAERIGEDTQWTQVMAQVACASLLGVDDLASVVDWFESDSLREMKELPTSDPEQASLDVESIVEMLILDKRRREMRARIEWATYARHVLHRHGARVAEGRPGRSS
ncbi:MAG TPA: helix-turn-helix transcriptional regulator [Solirubrobacteraceae bacterium]|nr:helix-turn-helix transcriptional regulator [Solirubrobacteraceae bacterium]